MKYYICRKFDTGVIMDISIISLGYGTMKTHISVPAFWRSFHASIFSLVQGDKNESG
jgi:hypothetical protein